MNRFNQFNEHLKPNLSNINESGKNKLFEIVTSDLFNPATGKIKDNYIPPLAIGQPYTVADIAARNALTVQSGDVAIVASENKNYVYNGSTWLELLQNNTPQSNTFTLLSPTGSFLFNDYSNNRMLRFSFNGIFDIMGSIASLSTEGSFMYSLGGGWLFRDSVGNISLTDLRNHVLETSIHFTKESVYKLTNSPDSFTYLDSIDQRIFRIYNDCIFELGGANAANFTNQAQFCYSIPDAGHWIFKDAIGLIDLRVMKNIPTNNYFHQCFGAGANITTAGANVLIGSYAGFNLTTGDGNIIVGSQAYGNLSTFQTTNSIIIGNTCAYNSAWDNCIRNICIGQEVLRNASLSTKNDFICIGTQNSYGAPTIGASTINIGAYNSECRYLQAMTIGSGNYINYDSIILGSNCCLTAMLKGDNIFIGNKICYQGNAFQDIPTISIGTYSNYNGSLGGSVCIGFGANYSNGQASGTYSIAIGNQAGYNNLHDKSIILNSSGSILNTSANNSFHVSNMRNTSSAPSYALYYNAATKEIHYDSACSRRIKTNFTEITGINYLNALCSLKVYDFNSLDDCVNKINKRKRGVIAEDVASQIILSDIVDIIPEYKLLKNNPLKGQIKSVKEVEILDPETKETIKQVHKLYEDDYIEETLINVATLDKDKFINTLLVGIQELKKIIDAQQLKINDMSIKLDNAIVIISKNQGKIQALENVLSV